MSLLMVPPEIVLIVTWRTPYDVDHMRVLPSAMLLATSLVLAGCSLLDQAFEGASTGEPLLYPDVVAVELRSTGERAYDVVVTMSSPYDSAARYADGWRVLDPQGDVLGEHTLLHDHADEQPFTRTQRDLHIPVGVTEVTVEGRDQVSGFGGATITVAVPE
jgi:hypothetical protein